MQNLKSVDGFGSRRKIAEVGNILGLGGRLRPQRGDPGHRVEPLQIFQTGAGFIVISANHAGDILPHPFRDNIGVGAISDNIAAAQDPIVSLSRMLEDGF